VPVRLSPSYRTVRRQGSVQRRGFSPLRLEGYLPLGHGTDGPAAVNVSSREFVLSVGSRGVDADSLHEGSTWSTEQPCCRTARRWGVEAEVPARTGLILQGTIPRVYATPAKLTAYSVVGGERRAYNGAGCENGYVFNPAVGRGATRSITSTKSYSGTVPGIRTPGESRERGAIGITDPGVEK
jgi:hypothetical protein